MTIQKRGRDAGTGHFKKVAEAQADKEGSIVETVKKAPKPQPAKAPKGKGRRG